MASRTFVVGDIHGAYHALVQCLERCGFRKDIDTLITLGDICDGWPYVNECVEELLTVINRIDVMGNHDEWLRRWLKTGRHPDNWRQGGMGTVTSYMRYKGNEDTILPIADNWRYDEYTRYTSAIAPNNIPDSHKEFFNNQRLYYKDKRNRLFVHGGFYKFQPLDMQALRTPDVFYWDRELWDEALSVHKGESLKFAEEFSEIFIGHTATLFWTKYLKALNSHILLPSGDNDCPPMKADIIYNLDTGAGSSGKLTIMNVDTHEYWQSDPVGTFYGEYKPRG